MARPLSDAPEIPDMVAANIDLHALYRDTRAVSPVARNPMGFVLGLHARQMDTILSDVTRQMENEQLMMQGITDGPLFEGRGGSMLFSNGDVHRRRRQPMSRTFAFKLMEGMRPRAASLAAELIEPRLGAGEIDFLGEISANVPARIIAEILGIPRSDLPYFQKLADAAVKTLGFFDPSLRAEYEANSAEFDSYVGSMLDERRKKPRGDFLSEFVAAADEAKELTEQEIRSNVVTLIIAGSDTTKNSIAATLALLLEHPDQWAALVANPDGVKKGAATEGLRYEPVALGVPRFSIAPFELDGYDVPPGRLVIFSIVSACRDPEVYSNPDTFDIHRTDHPRWLFTFGGGAHRCLGEALARVEIEETLAAIARLAPKTELAGPRPRLANAPIRAVDQMKVAFA